MNSSELEENIQNIKQLFESDNPEAGIMMIVSLNELKLTAALLDGCRIDKDGNIILNAFMEKYSSYSEYIFFNLFLLTPQDSNLHDSLIHKNVNKLIINRYREDEFPEDLSPLINLEELKLDLDYKGIPEQIYKLKTLKYLDINAREINYIPNEIFTIESLVSLMVRPPVLELPSTILIMKKLKHLDVNCSNLQNVSKEFLEIENLDKLILRSTKNMISRKFDHMFELNYERPSDKKINISFYST